MISKSRLLIIENFCRRGVDINLDLNEVSRDLGIVFTDNSSIQFTTEAPAADDEEETKTAAVVPILKPAHTYKELQPLSVEQNIESRMEQLLGARRDLDKAISEVEMMRQSLLEDNGGGEVEYCPAHDGLIEDEDKHHDDRNNGK